MAKRKKTPSVRIPAAVLRKEAQKAAKKMIQQEKMKEKKKAMREKAKNRAKKKISTQKEQKEQWSSFMDSNFKKDLIAASFIGIAIILIALYLSTAPLSVAIATFIHELFGLGTWIVPIVLTAFGFILLFKREIQFPGGRIFALIVTFCVLLGIIHLFSPENEALALASRYGGKIGFALSYLPRFLFGNLVAGLLLTVVGVICALIGFRIQLSELIHRETKIKKIQSSSEQTSPSTSKKKTSLTKEKESPEDKKRFINELKIIDSTKSTTSSKTTVKLEEKQDELTENKNKVFGEWEPPSFDLLQDGASTMVVNEKDLREKAEAIREKLEQFGIEVKMSSVHVGPTVTQFTLEPSAGVKLNKISSLKDDLCLALASTSVRIEAPIPGKKLVGIEIPNEKRSIVSMKEILESEAWKEEESNLKLALGRDVAGKPMVYDLSKAPHLLIAGKTGSGKSVATNAFLMSLLWQNSPEDLRLILIDPKRVELKPYDHLPHLLTPVITEPEKAVSALAWAVAEMNRRYRMLSENGVRNLKEYNEIHTANPEPHIVIVVDELADLMMVAGKDVEAAICRIAQMARAVGMHLIIATQRPSVDVVTGLIKANLPTRIAFKVASGIDSRTIIDGIGAEDLLGFGDMLHLDGNSGMMARIQGLYVTNQEVERVTNHIKLQFPEMMANDEVTTQSIAGMAKGGVLTVGTDRKEITDADLDAKFQDAVNLAMETGKASASFLQRHLEVGYARAARILDQMENKGIVGPAKGSKPREVFGRQE